MSDKNDAKLLINLLLEERSLQAIVAIKSESAFTDSIVAESRSKLYQVRTEMDKVIDRIRWS